jgi:hypothetical protein
MRSAISEHVTIPSDWMDRNALHASSWEAASDVERKGEIQPWRLNPFHDLSADALEAVIVALDLSLLHENSFNVRLGTPPEGRVA